MPKIVTITFNPSLDKSAVVEVLIPEKKLECYRDTSQPGGGGINVARVLTELGMTAVAVFPSGGYTGLLLNKLLEDENVPAEIIAVSNATRENFIIREQSTGHQFRFGMPANKLTQKEWKSCLTEVEKIDDVDFIIVSGSLPPGVPVLVFRQLSEIARKKNAKFIVDTSGKGLKYVLFQDVYLLKPSLGELAYLAGRKKIVIAEAGKVAKAVLRSGHCEILVVSLGSEGAILVTKDELFTVKPPIVDVKSTVGAGDSLVAGIVYALASGYDLEASLQFGVACGTAAVLNYGAELCHKEDVKYLYKMIAHSVAVPV